MKLLFISPDFKPMTGGIAQVAWNLAKQADNKGHDVKVLAQKCKNDDLKTDLAIERFRFQPDTPNKFKTIRILQTIYFLIKTKLFLSSRIKKYKPDICLLTSCTLAASFALMSAKNKLAVFFHGEEFTIILNPKYKARLKTFKKFLNRIDYIFTNSSFTLSELNRINSNCLKKAIAVGCGTELKDSKLSRQEARKQLGIEQNDFVIITISRIIDRKGIDTVIEAMPLILKKIPNAKYLIVGSGEYLSSLEKLTEKLKLKNNVKFMGRVSEEDKLALLKSSDIYAMLSRPGNYGEVEGFGISFLEANMLGLPVVASKCGGIVDAVEDGFNGILVDYKNQENIANAIVKLSENKDLCLKLAQNGKDRIETKYNWSCITDKIIAQLEKL